MTESLSLLSGVAFKMLNSQHDPTTGINAGASSLSGDPAVSDVTPSMSVSAEG